MYTIDHSNHVVKNSYAHVQHCLCMPMVLNSEVDILNILKLGCKVMDGSPLTRKFANYMRR